jgi:hypothetical protein
MWINITGEAERFIADEIAAGRLQSANEFVESLIQGWRHETCEYHAQHKLWPNLPDEISVDELANRQGVRPITDPMSLKADFWPQGERIEDLEEEIATLRRCPSPRELND